MKNFIAGIFSLVVLCCFSVTYAKTGDLNVTRVNQKVTSCNTSQSRDVNYYITGTSYTVYPLDNFKSNDLGDLLIGGKSNGSSIDIRSNGVISNCDDWGRASFVAPNNKRVRVFQNYDGCTFNIGKKSTDFVAQIHYNVGYKNVKSCSSNNDPYVNGPLSYFPQNGTQYLSYNTSNNKICYNDTLNIHAGECLNYRVFRCGDGLINGYQGNTNYEKGTFLEKCDPKAQPWIDNNACDPVTCKGKTPVCSSSYNGQAVSSLVPGNYLCNIGTMTGFHETSTGWTWKCDNVAGTDANCSAKKANNGKLDVVKTLVSETKYVTKVGQELDWEIKVTAKGGNVENVKIKDYLPKILSYKDNSTSATLPAGVKMESKEPTQGVDSKGNYLQWNTTGTLINGQSIILRITTKVKEMPKTTDNYENVACARAEGLDEECKPVPVNPEGVLKIEKTLTGKKTVETTGQVLTWEVKIWAESGDVTDFEIWDVMPKKLTLVDGTLTGNTQGIKLTKKDKTTESGDNIIYYRDAEGTLKEGNPITMVVKTRVNEMPEADEDVLNVACVIKNNDDKPTCNGDKTKNPKLRIKKYILDGDKEVKNITVEVGNTITYIIHFGNSGKAAATITSIKDFLPKNVQYKSGSIHINRSNGTQVGDADIGFKIENGVRIEIYGGMTLEPGDEGYIIITGEIKSDNQDHRTNFACIYLNDKQIGCDDASHDIGTPPPPPPPPTNPSCRKMEVDGSTVTCYSNGISTRFRLKCGNSIIGHSDEDKRATERPFHNVHCSEKITCEVLDSYMGTQMGQVCKEGPNETETPQGCFNVNEGNFSIEEGEIMPFYWNMANLDSDYYGNLDNYTEMNGDYSNAKDNYENGGTCNESQDGKIAKDSMVCTFIIADGSGNHYGIRNGEYEYNYLYKIEGPCLSKDGTAITKEPLIEARYNQMVKNYCDGSRTCYFYYGAERSGIDRFKRAVLPTAVYYIENFGKKAKIYANVGNDSWDFMGSFPDENNKAFGEYKILLTGVKYSKCENGNWTKQSSDSTCNTNFMLTNSYTVQKTPSGNLKASTTELDKYLSYDGERVFTKLLNAIKTTEYNSNSNVDNAMKTFIDKYSKLAVKVNLGNNSFLEGTDVRKVPGKNIYFVSGSLTVKGGTQSIKTPFTIVQTSDNASVTISGNVQHNMMLLTNGNIIFKGDCESDQTVKGIFYAKGKLNRYAKARNENIDTSVWCTNGGLHVRGVLIGSNFDKLMDNSRSNINDRFIGQVSKRKEYVMNGASVLIEYSPSIFSKSTMPPGAEDFTTALSIYKQ